MSGIRFALMTVLCLSLPINLPAAELTRDQALQLGKDLGTTNNPTISNTATNPDLSTVPGYQGTDVPETQYYGAGLGIEDTARQALPDSPVGTYVQNSALSRPLFTIDRTDPIVQRGDAIAADPQALLGQQLTG